MTVKQRQHLLAYLGYYVGNIDGDWGSGSHAACTAFQQDFGGIVVDGHGGTETDKALKHAVAYDLFKVDISNEETTTGSFWDDIQYFKRDEFRCKCGGKYCNGYPVEINHTLIRVAERAREHFGKPIIVSSGIRCNRHNSSVGGVSNSRHKLGKAMDFHVQGMSASTVLAWVKKQPEIRYTYAIDSGYVHMDVY